VEARIIARGTPGFSGADLANLVNEAALLAARKNRRVVSMQELEDAKDKVMMGAERRSMVMTDEEKRLTAYHEAGHAIATLHCPASDPIHKATIIPRGRALGMVMRLPEKDQFSMARDQLEANLVVAMGGRVAEDLIFGREKVTTGASNDIAQATAIARKMVTEWGMSDKLGPLRYNENQEEIFLGHSVAQQKNVSDATAEVIDQEVRNIVDGADADCRKILRENIDDLHTLANALLEYETLTGDEIKALLRGEPIVRDKDDDVAPPTGVRSSVPTTGGAPLGSGPTPEPQGG
jgi:cell division protease FtsH